MLNRRTQKPEARSQKIHPQVTLLTSGFCILTSLALFLGFSLYQLDLPGFYYDEAFDLTPMLNLMHGEPTELLRGIGLPLGQISYPVMRMDYMGSLNGYLSVPFMAVFGVGYTAARLEPIFFASITLILAHVLARRWFGTAVATLTSLLLAVCPSFIWFSRQGITVTSVMTVFSLGSWILLDIGRRRRTEDGGWTAKRHPPSSVLRPFFFAGLCLGLGLWAKINFVWWIALTGIITLVWLLTRPKPTPSSPLRPFLPLLPFALVGFLIGAAPFIYYNLAGLASGQMPATLGLLFKALSNSTEYGVHNADFVGNINKRFQDFATFLNGSYFWFFTFTFGNVLAVPMFVISLVVGGVLVGAGFVPARANGARLALVPTGSVHTGWHKWLALVLCIAVYLPLSAFTVSDLWATHFYPILPLPQMVMACAAVWLAESVVRGAWSVICVALRPTPHAPRLITFALAAALLAPTFSRDVWVNQQYHAQLGKTGGSGRFSDAIYKLAAYLDAEHVAEPIALDWGITAQTRVLTADRVRPREIFGFSTQPSDEFRQQTRELLKDPTRRYIVLWGGDSTNVGFAVYNRRQEFTRLANELGRQVVETFIAHERSGLPVYVVLQAE